MSSLPIQLEEVCEHCEQALLITAYVEPEDAETATKVLRAFVAPSNVTAYLVIIENEDPTTARGRRVWPEPSGGDLTGDQYMAIRQAIKLTHRCLPF
jgi:hypothetical protein